MTINFPKQYNSPEDLEFCWCFCIINCVVATLGAFLLFTTIQKEGRGYGMIKSFSVNSYGMYLMHLLWLPFWFLIVQPNTTVGIAIPLVTLLTFISCFVTTKLISYILGSRWIIG